MNSRLRALIPAAALLLSTPASGQRRPEGLVLPTEEGKHCGVAFEMWSAFAQVTASDGRAFSVATFFFTGKVFAFNVSGVYGAVLDVQRDEFRDSRDLVTPVLGRARHTYGQLEERFDRNVLRRDATTGAYEIRIETGDLEYDLELTPARAPLGLGLVPVGPGRRQRSYVSARASVRGTLRLANGEEVAVEGIGLFQHAWGDSPEASAAQSMIVGHLDDGTDIVVFRGLDPDSTILGLSSDGTGSVLREGFELEADTALRIAPFSFPSGWRLRVPGAELEIQVTPGSGRRVSLLGIPYLLGRCEVRGERNGMPVSGSAYVYIRGRQLADYAEARLSGG